jgi:transposase
MLQRRSKTDRLDSLLLAQLLRVNQIPFAYIPEERYQRVREVTRHRARLVRGQTQVKIGLRVLLAHHNVVAPYRYPFGPRGLYWFSRQDLGPMDNAVRDELLARFAHYASQIHSVDQFLETLRPEYPEVTVLCELTGIGLFSALMVIGEFGDVERFHRAKQAAAYTGLTTRVFQSGDKCRYGGISRQGLTSTNAFANVPALKRHAWQSLVNWRRSAGSACGERAERSLPSRPPDRPRRN